MITLLLISLVPIAFGVSSSSDGSRIKDLIDTNSRMVAEILEKRLSSPDHNSRVRPGADQGDPLVVHISINVNDISSISEVAMEYSMTLYLRQTWKDTRLSYANESFNRSITLNYNQFDRIWTPDLFIRNLKSGSFHSITVPNRLLRLSPDGTVFFSQRLSLTLSCAMLLGRYPMDNQTCKIEFSSYAYSKTDLLFDWRPDDVAVELNSAINLPEYIIKDITSVDCSRSTPGAFPCLRADFHLTRRLRAYILNTYLPSFLVVLLSWLSFWIDPESAPARTSLSILTILTITTQSSGLMRSMPSGSLTKAIDVWMATCLVFVFGAFIEYSIVNTLARRKRAENANKAGQKANEIGDTKSAEADEKDFGGGTRSDFWSLFNWREDPAMTIERASRIIFPLTFFIFCLVYWPVYLLG